jgi:hypothetical protein
MTHASWDEPRLLVELPYAGHLLCYCAQHELLVVREPTGSLRQLHTAAEFAALTSKTGIVTLQAQYRSATRLASASSTPAASPNRV